ncbi:MAG: 1-phosphofructokinase family hexose kinase [Erysipelotrichaceae bacterium]|nr:1-phosphofructokinase family hexose kinase [Erysipelotrichaceae bacterium]
MIYTFTPNPAIDYYIDLDDFVQGKINRTGETLFRVAGKGINCSLILDLLKIRNSACFFSAGFTGDHITDSLRKYEYITAVPFETEGTTRINVKFIGAEDTAINAPGPIISEEAKSELFGYVGRCTSDDHFMISGSLPAGFGKDDLLRLCRKIAEKGTRLVLDVPNLKAGDLEDLDVYLIKPNLEELGMMFGKEICREECRDYVNRLLSGGVRNVLLSLGSEGALYMGGYGNYRMQVPSVEAYSTVGAGDSLLAGFVGALSQGKDIVSSLKTAGACAVARITEKELDSASVIDEMYGKILVAED